MKIRNLTLICPKCKEEYNDRMVMSFNSRMIPSKDMFKNKITNCSKCNRKLVEKNYIDFFNEEGDFYFDLKTIIVNDNDIWNQYFNIVEILMKIQYATVEYKNIILNGVVEIVENQDKDDRENEFQILNHILIKILYNGKEIPIIDLQINKVKYSSIGDLFNSFHGEYFTKRNNQLREFLRGSLNRELKDEFKIKINSLFDFKLEKKLIKYSK